MFEGQDRVVSTALTLAHQGRLVQADLIFVRYIGGPIEMIAVSTRSYYGIFKALDLVGRVAYYAAEVY
jgi:hypothetical protein